MNNINFDYAETDLDIHFIGQWEVHHIDKYGSIKSGTNSRSTVVRSQVNRLKGVVKLVAYIPDRNGVTDVIMDGSTGFHSKITERIAANKEHEWIRVDFLYIHVLSEEQIRKGYTKTDDGYRVWKTIAEIDDIVYNQNKEYTYPFYYFAEDTIAPKLLGMYVEIPIKHFNHYVMMRDLWFKKYKGAQEII